MNKKTVDLILIVILAGNILLMGYIIYAYFYEEGVECISNPLQFGYKKIQEANDYPLSCQCSLITTTQGITLKFNSTDTWVSDGLDSFK